MWTVQSLLTLAYVNVRQYILYINFLDEEVFLFGKSE